MRGALVIIGDGGEVDQVSIIADTDKEADLVWRALRKWTHASRLETEAASNVEGQGQGSGGAS